jgi:NitT/TauT family transport system substrate-binding protein
MVAGRRQRQGAVASIEGREAPMNGNVHRRNPTGFRRLASGLGALMLAAMLVPTAAPARAELPRLAVATQLTLAFLPVMVMQEQKLIEKHAAADGLGNVAVDWTIFGGGTGQIEAVLSGNVHLVASGITPFITLWAKSKGAVRGTPHQ